MHPVGTRVGVILKSRKDLVLFVGYGLLQGFHTSPDGTKDNPLVNLNSGETIFCSGLIWGKDEVIHAHLEEAKTRKAKIIEVDPTGAPRGKK